MCDCKKPEKVVVRDSPRKSGRIIIHQPKKK